MLNISAFNQTTLKRAIIYLENSIRTYYLNKNKNNYPTPSKSPTNSYNSFDILSYDDDDEEEPPTIILEEQFPALTDKTKPITTPKPNKHIGINEAGGFFIIQKKNSGGIFRV